MKSCVTFKPGASSMSSTSEGIIGVPEFKGFITSNLTKIWDKAVWKRFDFHTPYARRSWRNFR